MSLQKRMARAVKFEFGAESGDFHDVFSVDRRENGKWSVKDGNFVYDGRSGAFVLEDSQNRDDEFFQKDTRFTLLRAFEIAEAIEKEGKVAFQRRKAEEIKEMVMLGEDDGGN